MKVLHHRSGWSAPFESQPTMQSSGFRQFLIRHRDIPAEYRKDEWYFEHRAMYVPGEGPLSPSDWEELQSRQFRVEVSHAAIDAIV